MRAQRSAAPPPPQPPPIDPIAHVRLAQPVAAGAPGLPVGRTALAGDTPWRYDAPSTWRYRRDFALFATALPGAPGSVQASLQLTRTQALTHTTNAPLSPEPSCCTATPTPKP